MQEKPKNPQQRAQNRPGDKPQQQQHQKPATGQGKSDPKSKDRPTEKAKQ